MEDKPEINDRKITVKCPSKWRLNKTYLNNTYVKENILKGNFLNVFSVLTDKKLVVSVTRLFK